MIKGLKVSSLKFAKRSSETQNLSCILLPTLYKSLLFLFSRFQYWFISLPYSGWLLRTFIKEIVLFYKQLSVSIIWSLFKPISKDQKSPIFIEGMIIKDISKNNKYSVNWQLKYVSSISAENWGTQTCVSLWERVQRPPMCVSWWSIVQRGRSQTSFWMTTSHSRGPSGSHLPLTSQTEWTTSTAMDSSTLDWTPVIAWWTIDGRWKLQVRHWGRRESDLIGAD